MKEKLKPEGCGEFLGMIPSPSTFPVGSASYCLSQRAEGGSTKTYTIAVNAMLWPKGANRGRQGLYFL